MEDKIKCYMHSQLCENVPEELCTLMEEEEYNYIQDQQYPQNAETSNV